MMSDECYEALLRSQKDWLSRCIRAKRLYIAALKFVIGFCGSLCIALIMMALALPEVAVYALLGLEFILFGGASAFIVFCVYAFGSGGQSWRQRLK